MTPVLRTSGDRRRVRGHMAAARQPAGGDAAPEETNDARLSEENSTPSLPAASTATRRAGRALVRWVAIDAEHCAARAVTDEDMDPEEYVVGNS